MELKAIETKYSSYRFRSRLEARWAVFFDRLGVRWHYEPEGYVLDSAPRGYLPDFFLPDTQCYVEAKPEEGGSPAERIYCAGKMDRWRDALNLRGHHRTGPSSFDGESHGAVFGLHGNFRSHDQEQSTPVNVVGNCLRDIVESTVLFAWVSSLDSYATLAEVGYAMAHGKHVYVAFHDELFELVKEKSTPFSGRHGIDSLHDLWFIENMSDGFAFAPAPQVAFDRWFNNLNEEEKKCAEVSASGKRVFLVRGDPQTERLAYLFQGGELIVRQGGILAMSDGLGILFRSEERIREAALYARQVRFEHGETPKVSVPRE